MQLMPYRTQFVPPTLHLPANLESQAWSLSALLDPTIFHHLLSHPRVALIDPDDNQLADGDGNLLNSAHPQFDAYVAGLFFEGRREEVLWFEITLDSQRAVVRLKSRLANGAEADFAATGGGELSDLLSAAIQQWLGARDLDAAPRAMESFTSAQFLEASAELDRFGQAKQAQDPNVNVNIPEALPVAFCHAMFSQFSELQPPLMVFERDPENPWALREHFMKEVHEHATPRTEIRKALSLAPQYGKAYLSMFGEDVTGDEKLASFATAAMLLPGNPFTNDNYASALIDAGRWEEGYRYAERALQLNSLHITAHLTSMQAQNEISRAGAALRDADGRVGFLTRGVEESTVHPENPDLCIARLRRSDAYVDVGRLEEAIQIREQALADGATTREKWPKMYGVLDAWKSDPSRLAMCYAREGHYRGDPGRVREGLAHAKCDDGPDVAKWIEAHLSLGLDDLALLAAAHHSSKNISRRGEPRIAAARAFLANSKLEGALDHLQIVQLRFPQQRFDGELNRTLRLAACLPAEDWDAAVRARLDKGALRLAKLAARDAADFVPGASGLAAVTEALGESAATPFNAAWMEPLKGALENDSLEAIDTFLDGLPADDLAAADTLAQTWHSVVGKAPKGGGFEPKHVLYLAGGAMIRYLALTTQGADVRAGAYRQIATDAMNALGLVSRDFSDPQLNALLSAVEHLPAVDPWLLDTWLLRLERALDLEASHGAHLEGVLEGLQLVPALLRGDERVAYELRLAHDCATLDGKHDLARRAYERCLRAIGGTAAIACSDLAKETLQGEAAVDAQWTAHTVAPTSGAIAVNLAETLFATGRAELGWEVLVGGLPMDKKDARQKQQARCRPWIEKAGLLVPFDWQQASSKAMELMQAGKFEESIPYSRWCDALDSNNATTLRNLAIAYARGGRVAECVATFGEMDIENGPSWAGQALREAQQYEGAVLAYRYAQSRFRTPEEWLAMGGAAWYLEDDESGAEAYGKAYELSGGNLQASHLCSYATGLNGVGRYEEALKVAKEGGQKAGQDATWIAASANHQARALLGLGKAAEAVAQAKIAVKNATPDTMVEYQETLKRAQANDPHPTKVLRGAALRAQASELLASGDVKKAIEVAEEERTWGGNRIAAAAREYRFESENARPVAAAAMEDLGTMLDQTAGQLDIDAGLIRARALRTRENLLIQVDPPPPLGARLPREAFLKAFAERSQAAQANAPAPKFNQAKAMQAASDAVQKVNSGQGGDPDPELFPGTKIAKLSDYVKVMKAMQTGNPMGALAKLGLDMGTYSKIAMQWGQMMAKDPTLAVKMAKMMAG